MSVLYPSAPGLCGALPKEVHTPEASKPAEAVLRLNQLFDIAGLEGLAPDQKKKERLMGLSGNR